jgi:hypothetical protein
MLQFAPLPQLTLQLPVHVMWQSLLLPHDTLPLAPSVASHVVLSAQEMLHESPQLPRHVLPAAHAREQLPVQVELEKLHICPPAQVQLPPPPLQVTLVTLAEQPAASALSANSEQSARQDTNVARCMEILRDRAGPRPVDVGGEQRARHEPALS